MRYCENCGKEIAADALFCENCGTHSAALSGKQEEKTKPAPQAEAVQAAETQTAGGSGEIKLCPDGKYRWIYEYPMMKNPTVLFTVLKVLAISAALPGLITFFCGLSDGFFKALISTLCIYVLVMAIFFVLSLIGYTITAAVYGWKYIVLFEMDEKGIAHIQQGKQFKKAQGLAWLTMMAGAAAGRPGIVGTGILAASKNSITSEFKNVKKVIGLRRRNTIKANQLFAKNQIYTDPLDYDFVWEYMTSRCKNAVIKK